MVSEFDCCVNGTSEFSVDCSLEEIVISEVSVCLFSELFSDCISVVKTFEKSELSVTLFLLVILELISDIISELFFRFETISEFIIVFETNEV